MTTEAYQGLEGIRSQLDAIDRELAQLLQRRASVAAQVAPFKAARRMSSYAPAREVIVIGQAREAAHGGLLTDQDITAIYTVILSRCRAVVSAAMQHQGKRA